ncbi:hypothetical protein OB955_04795 [Halobacteria archaeon AArc-m2/3/4]|uniref:Uncharacterized protein n=1 Tax=Natronoglomus mannanivorans TaxID=2979990 RepID=A0ABT2QAZ8_9EURY|nr:hypothetical protein [Halobacteria archaeon AArc-m2/3/4]
MLRIVIKIVIVGSLLTLLTAGAVSIASADETPPAPIDMGDESTDEIPDGAEYVHVLTDDVRIVEYEAIDDGDKLRVVIDADTDATGSYTDDGVTGGGALPPVQTLTLEEGRNTITIDVEDRLIATFTVDGQRWQTPYESESQIHTSTEQNRSIAAVFVAGFVIFAAGISSGLAIRKIRKEQVKVIK